MHPLAKFVRIFCKYNGKQMNCNRREHQGLVAKHNVNIIMLVYLLNYLSNEIGGNPMQ